MKVALINCISKYQVNLLIKLLLSEGYFVNIIQWYKSPSEINNDDFLVKCFSDSDIKFKIYNANIAQISALVHIIETTRPNEIYHLAKIKDNKPVDKEILDSEFSNTFIKILESVQILNLAQHTKVFASIFQAPKVHFTELFFQPIIHHYRTIHQIFITCGAFFNSNILINNRGSLSDQIAKNIYEIALGVQKRLTFSDLSKSMSLIHEKDYVKAMWLALQQRHPGDFIIDSGIKTTLRDFVRLCFNDLGVEIVFAGKGSNERAVVIDVDQAQLLSFDLDDTFLKPGTTVVLVEQHQDLIAENNEFLHELIYKEHLLKWIPTYSLPLIISDIMKSQVVK
jgi:GDPmannose 4,6-dehydratase